ncbi:MAG: PmoA family protein, partial [Planctomycetaceae bacterium]|nr:PmoA family protein [Planctomycetaceae bacterium]
MSENPRCRILPEAGHQVSFQIDGREVLRWHEGRDYPRPYFYPVVGPSGQSLTR